MELHMKTHSENGEGECWWSRIASPYPDANNVAPPATHDEEEYRRFFIYAFFLFFLSGALFSLTLATLY